MKKELDEREEVLRQISEIKNHLVDKETFFPYNYNACHVWSIIVVILTLGMLPSYQYGIVFGTVVMFILIAIGFIIEGSLTKKVNESYDIDDCTKRQQYILQNFLMISLFMIVMSTILAMQGLYVLIFLMWLFLVSLGYFALGFVLNIEKFTKMGQFNMLLSLILLVVGTSFNLLLGENSLFLALIQAVVIFGLAIMPTSIAWHQQKDEKLKKVSCSV